MADATFELLTPRGALGGVAVVAVRGVDRVPVVSGWLDVERARHLRARSDLLAASESEACAAPFLVDLWIAGEWIDQALVVVRPESIELHLHGSEAVLDGLEAHCGPLRRPALDPVERLLVEATDPALLALAAEQRRLLASQPGDGEQTFDGYCDRLGRAAADPRPESAAIRERARGEWVAARERSAVVAAMREPSPVVLVGAQNAGKSTLLNALLMAPRALVGPVPGLTRDPVAAVTTLSGYRYEWIDTAGEAEEVAGVATAPPIGHAGIDADAIEAARSQRDREGVLRLVLVDGSEPLPRGFDRWLHAVPEPRWLVRTKVDLPAASWAEPTPDLWIECVGTDASARVRATVGEWLRRVRGLPSAGPVGGIAALDADQRARLAALSFESR